MVDTRIVLSGLWAALMLTYLLGDVLRIFAGDFKAGEILGMQPTQAMWLFMAGLMLTPLKKLDIHRQGAKDAKKSKAGIKIDRKNTLSQRFFRRSS